MTRPSESGTTTNMSMDIYIDFCYRCELAREYYVLEDMAIRDAAKPLISVAIHPSGYYLAASFIDRIRMYHILHDELRQYKNVELKNCSKMKFS
jgi:hypothetical protein